MTTKAKSKAKNAEEKAASATPAPPAEITGAENTAPDTSESSDGKMEEVKQEPENKGPEKKEPAKPAVDAEKQLRKKLQPYFDAHPSTDKFFVSSDGQPFFELQWAREHQKSVDPEKKVTIVNR